MIPDKALLAAPQNQPSHLLKILCAVFLMFSSWQTVARASELCKNAIEHPIVKGTIWSDCNNTAGPAIIIWGGSDGGDQFATIVAQNLAGKGLVAVALPYWNFDGLPSALERIDLEYFDQTVDHVATLPNVDPAKIFIMGYSRGSEAAFLIAKNNSKIAGVVGLVPSNYVGANIDFRDFWDLDTPWMRGGVPLAYATTRPNKPGANWQEMMTDMEKASPETSRQDYEKTRSLPEYADAIIDSAAIGAPVLLLSVRDDETWASYEQSVAIENARKTDSSLVTLHVTFNGVGHSFLSNQLASDYAGDKTAAKIAISTIKTFVRGQVIK